MSFIVVDGCNFVFVTLCFSADNLVTVKCDTVFLNKYDIKQTTLAVHRHIPQYHHPFIAVTNYIQYIFRFQFSDVCRTGSWIPELGEARFYHHLHPFSASFSVSLHQRSIGNTQFKGSQLITKRNLVLISELNLPFQNLKEFLRLGN